EVARGEFWHDAHAHESEAELRDLRRDDEIEGQDHGDADADGWAVHCRDQGLRRAYEADPIEAARQAALAAGGVGARVLAVDARFEGVLDVGAGAEAAAFAGDDDRADRAVFVRALDGVGHLFAHL